MTQQLMESLQGVVQEDAGKHPSLIRWLQSLVDLLGRPTNNRVSASQGANYSVTSAADVSSGVGTGPITPKRYGETFVLGIAAGTNSTNNSPVVISIYRTSGAIPAQGAAPNAGDVRVAYAVIWVAVGGETWQLPLVGQDTGLSLTTPYRYYFTVSNGTGGGQTTINAAGNFTVSEF